MANRFGKGESGKGKGRGFGDGESGKGKGRGFGDGDKFERVPGDEDVALEKKFGIEIMEPGESRVGYLFNMKENHHYDENNRKLSGLVLYFLARDGCTFRCTFLYRPYFFLDLKPKAEPNKLMDIFRQKFSSHGVTVEMVDKEDLALEDHIVGNSRRLLKLTFDNTRGMDRARRDLMREMSRVVKDDTFNWNTSPDKQKASGAVDQIEAMYEHDVVYVNRVCIDKEIRCGKWYQVDRNQLAVSMDDVWDTQSKVVCKEEMLYKPGLRTFAWDIETTKEPLKFPDASRDQIMMISIMVDQIGFLITNRQIVGADLDDFEYTPKPQYEGVFEVFNEPDEPSLLRRFFKLMVQTSPHILVTFNGDFFDFPFVIARAKVYDMDTWEEGAFAKASGGDEHVGRWIVHMDCFNWVQRDSYLPCGSRGLKAVAKYKLKYDPVELDPEDMMPFAKERPHELGAYSVSDAVATYYLYMKLVHDFIFALCTIIPYGPDDVLRKGSGTLCESLLMVEAFRCNVLFPNKHHDEAIAYHEGTNRLIEASTYEGARVECMRVGVFRSDIRETFNIEPSAVESLLNDVERMTKFFLEMEEKVKLEDVTNFDEVCAEIKAQLRVLCDPEHVKEQIARGAVVGGPDGVEKKEGDYTLKLFEYEVFEGKASIRGLGKKVKKASYRVVKDEFPLIYHLDVGAMYPNIILSNRLQPSAIVSRDFCAACSYNDPSNKCQRFMDWSWRGDLYMATRADVNAIVREMESESKRYNHKDFEGNVTRVPWSQLTQKEQNEETIKAVRIYSQKAYRRVKSSVYEDKNDIVCQRENSFYVDTVRNFRDRRYTFKALTKKWNKALAAAEAEGNAAKISEARDLAGLYDSLQLAHKCILNSFYGYVMRKGARWHSMPMAGIVTYTGSNLIREAREFCEQLGLPIELDTDGIWCCLPKTFPDKYYLKTKEGKKLELAYSNTVLNVRVHDKYTNHQYQNWNKETKQWDYMSENSIFFEIDGPYSCMVLPASTTEDVLLKKRYAVFEMDGSLAELKGFEMKRRGELKMLQIFQEEVFPVFLKGSTKPEVYQAVGDCANRWLDVLDSKGITMTDDEVLYYLSENKSMSKSVVDSGSYKSVQITTAKRLAEFLGNESLLTSPSVACHLLISAKPYGAKATDRAIPVKIFSAEPAVKEMWLRRWLNDPGLTNTDMRSIIDWDYYKKRMGEAMLKLIVVTAAYQKIPNPCPRVQVPEWLRKRIAEETAKFKQQSLAMWMQKKSGAGALAPSLGAPTNKRKLESDLDDMEDMVGAENVAPQNNFTPEKDKWSHGKTLSKWMIKESLKTGTAADDLAQKKDIGAAWARNAAEVLRMTWHIVAVETAASVCNSTELRIGDVLLAPPADAMDEEELVEAVLLGFVGNTQVRLRFLEDGKEHILSRDEVKRKEELGRTILWIAACPKGVKARSTIHRVQISLRRRILLALDGEFDPSDMRRPVTASDLRRGLQVWLRNKGHSKLSLTGTVTDSSSRKGLCAVSWSDGETRSHKIADLECKPCAATRVQRDAPRNHKHQCLIELEMDENEFQRQRNEGAIGDADGPWPRVSAIYESEMPLDFDLVTRLGHVIKVANPGTVDPPKGGTFRLAPEELIKTKPESGYLPGQTAARNAYLFFCFNKGKTHHAFAGIYLPSLGETLAAVCGVDPDEFSKMRSELEDTLAEQLQTIQEPGCAPPTTQLTAVSGKSLAPLLKWVDAQLTEMKQRDPGLLCVLCSQMSVAEMRGMVASSRVDQRQLRNLAALREMPVCRAPFAQGDGEFPALDWVRWIVRRFAIRIPQLLSWWKNRLALSRVCEVPVGFLPEKPAEQIPRVLDILYSRQLAHDQQVRWTGVADRPDLGQHASEPMDVLEGSVDKTHTLITEKDVDMSNGTKARMGLLNASGIYRSICADLSLKTKLCICALQHAKFLSDQEGGELSRKVVRKAHNIKETRNVDHTSEVSLTAFESLIAMVHQIIDRKNLVASDLTLAKRRVMYSAGVQTKELQDDLLDEDDDVFVQKMQEMGQRGKELQEIDHLRVKLNAEQRILDGLHGWLSDPSSLLYDPALLRKVHVYMDKTLKLLVSVLKKNGCTPIHATYNRVLFASGKLRIDDFVTFWDALRGNLSTNKALDSLEINAESCANLFYGVLWLNTANWQGVPIDRETGDIGWKVSSKWNIADFLPPAVRPSFYLYAGEFLLEPQRKLFMLSTCAREDEGHEGTKSHDPEQIHNMDMDDVNNDMDKACDDAGEDDAMDIDENPEPIDANKPDKDAPSEGNDAHSEGKDAPGLNMMKALDDQDKFIKTEFFGQLCSRAIRYLEEMQIQQQNETPGSADQMLDDELLKEEDDSDGSDVEGVQIEDKAYRRRERLRRHLQEKWSFPNPPGKYRESSTVGIEFMKTLLKVFQLDAMLKHENTVLQDKMCAKMSVSTFEDRVNFKTLRFPIILHDVPCKNCSATSQVDVTAHATRGPGLWVCENCNLLYEKEAMEARLVATLESCVQAWQAQEVMCKRCSRLRTSNLLNFCDCYGTFRTRFDKEDLRIVISVMRSVSQAQDLTWLNETVDTYESLL
eukprot:gnl/MRDRNA2_/MRDRNA2_77802_c0_seq1.p1 gnl/MRDRNA2_/MRDRNA2_77802_c0~~gnl/MRDRNA2_/MRDRNA2_77802_c0_seq1.p1  ORF type:complete len:2564 (-),score=510.18 gnl/MRDRNA2_/MRDRNA2_77802_c0_seq1:8-7699(-)